MTLRQNRALFLAVIETHSSWGKHLELGPQTIVWKRATRVILWPGSRVARGKMTVIGVPDCLNDCIIRIGSAQFRNLAVGRVIQPGWPHWSFKCWSRRYMYLPFYFKRFKWFVKYEQACTSWNVMCPLKTQVEVFFHQMLSDIRKSVAFRHVFIRALLSWR